MSSSSSMIGVRRRSRPTKAATCSKSSRTATTRRYVRQVLLIDEFHRAGAEIVFLNRPIGGTAEDDLLLQVQGVIAEYERAKILERGRRGRRHAAQSGSVSALTGAPFGYRYVSRSQGGGVARFEVVESEAHIVRRIFAWVGLDRLSLRAVCRRLQQMGCRTRQGSTYWHASTIRGMLDNPAYIGRAAFGRARFLPPRPRLRPIRGHLKPSPRATSCGLITKEFPRLCRGGSRSLTFTAIAHRQNPQRESPSTRQGIS
jgi:site-specific DNA recombinase